jgi:hypothetical protein
VAEDLRTRLDELARALEYPPTPELARAVRARLGAAQPPRGPRLRWRSRRALVLAVSLALLGAGGAAAAAVPGVRHAIGDLLGLRGASVRRVPRTPPAPAVAGRDLGPQVGLAEAARRAGFTPLRAHDALLGAIGPVHLSTTAGGAARVTLVYDGGTVTLTQLPSRNGLDVVRKLTPPATPIRRVRVRNGEPGIYVAGPHVVMYLDAAGRVVADRVRRAGRVLLWQRGPLLLRLEAAVSEARALQIARTVR